MKNECPSCGGQLQIKYKISLRNAAILMLYLLALFFSFTIIIRFSGWYGAIIVTALAILLGWFVHPYYERYTQCKNCNNITPL